MRRLLTRNNVDESRIDVLPPGVVINDVPSTNNSRRSVKLHL